MNKPAEVPNQVVIQAPRFWPTLLWYVFALTIYGLALGILLFYLLN